VQVHGHDIIHRDLKPENIMIRNEGIASESIVIVDFGLSAKFKATEKFSLDDKIGTILFMAPEQISNQSYGKVTFITIFNNSFRKLICMHVESLLIIFFVGDIRFINSAIHSFPLNIKLHILNLRNGITLHLFRCKNIIINIF